MTHHPAHHPDDLMLAAYATGAAEPEIALIVACHTAQCSHCRATVAALECAGGVTLADMAPAPLADGALARTLARLNTETKSPTAPTVMPPANDDTPAPLRAYMGHGLSAVPWKKAAPGLMQMTLYRRGTVAVRLLRVAPGVDVGQHTHRGEEYTLALRGGYSDVTGRYGPGDFQTAAPGVHHNPTADADGTCTILAVTTERLVFRHWWQRVGARLLGF